MYSWWSKNSLATIYFVFMQATCHFFCVRVCVFEKPCWLDIVLWDGYFSVPFKSFVLLKLIWWLYPSESQWNYQNHFISHMSWKLNYSQHAITTGLKQNNINTSTLLITSDFNSPSKRGIQYQLSHTRGNSQQISWWINFLIWQKVKWTYFLSSSSLAVSISIPSWSHCRVITSEPIKRVATSGRQIHSLISRCSATSCRSTSPSCPHHSKRRPHTTGERKNVPIVFGH